MKTPVLVEVEVDTEEGNENDGRSDYNICAADEYEQDEWSGKFEICADEYEQDEWSGKFEKFKRKPKKFEKFDDTHRHLVPPSEERRVRARKRSTFKS